MRWSWRILRVAGIGIHVHITFLLLPLWVAFAAYSDRHLWGDAWTAVMFVLVLFGVVVLHELGHALTAKRFGIQTRDITLLPIGGVARLERMPDKPVQELLVALAGPAVNVCLAVLLFAVLGASAQIGEWRNFGSFEQGSLVHGFLASLMWANVALAVFNLVPAFPMDGGRVLRSLLAMRLSYVRATNVAACVGQTLALLFGFVGLSSVVFGHFGPVSNPFLLFIAFFVWAGAGQEAEMVRMKEALGSVPAASVMMTDFRSLSPAYTLSQAAQYLLSGWQPDFPVIENGQLVGLLSRGALTEGLARHGTAALVGEVMTRQPPIIDPEEKAETALSRLRSGTESVLLVAREGQLFGMISRSAMSEYLALRGFLKTGLPTDTIFDEKAQDREAA